MDSFNIFTEFEMMDIYLEQEQLLMLILKQELELMQELKLKMEKYDPWNVHGFFTEFEMMDIYLEQEQLLMLILKQELELMQELKLKMEKYDPWNVHGWFIRMDIYREQGQQRMLILKLEQELEQKLNLKMEKYVRWNVHGSLKSRRMMDIYLEQEQQLMLILKQKLELMQEQKLELMQEQKLKMEKYDPWNVHGWFIRMDIYRKQGKQQILIVNQEQQLELFSSFCLRSAGAGAGAGADFKKEQKLKMEKYDPWNVHGYSVTHAILWRHAANEEIEKLLEATSVVDKSSWGMLKDNQAGPGPEGEINKMEEGLPAPGWIPDGSVLQCLPVCLLLCALLSRGGVSTEAGHGPMQGCVCLTA
ncbi:uncharacterized protein LOC124465899 isoform X4 [Hypomesus transpacificus]|uniref:uncharacterized protein LOC124465899 isoform X4 n=1 Tax=Hypomesus transpacificus TaxID=137520 RepID=UPI001F079AFD|nr:uncharacterized protein LOC124465899 isoform X4 [Hypomesus transpacificus]